MPNPVQIDHVVIAGSDLQAMRDDLAAVGFPSVEGGVHADGLTHNALIAFRDGSYLELIAPVPGKAPVDHYWWPFMQNNAGVCAWAIRSQDLDADSAFYRSLGITVSEPKPGGRKRIDGIQLEWRTAALTDKPLGTVFPFLIQDVTPRELRVPVANVADDIITGIEDVLPNLAFSPVRTYSEKQREYLITLQNRDENRLVGVFLSVTNIDAAVKGHNVNGNIFNNRKQFSAWIETKSALIGFKGDLTSPIFDLTLFRHRLAETIAWCVPRVRGLNEHSKFEVVEQALRSSVPEMPDTLHTLYDERGKPYSENDIVEKIRCKRGYDAFFEARSRRLVQEQVPIITAPLDLAGGRLLVFSVDDALYEGAMSPESNGFFDSVQDGPPWDTWVYHETFENLLICWVPPEMIPLAEAGLNVMSLYWCWWVTGDESYEFAQTLKRAGYRLTTQE